MSRRTDRALQLARPERYLRRPGPSLGQVERPDLVRPGRSGCEHGQEWQDMACRMTSQSWPLEYDY